MASRYRGFMDRINTQINAEQRPGLLLAGGLLLLLALLGRALTLGYASGDQTVVDRWIEHLQLNGFGAFKLSFYDYNPPYLYLLYLGGLMTFLSHLLVTKMISFLFDLSLAIAVAKLVGVAKPGITRGFFVFALTLCLPDVLLNSGVWAQVDAGYTGFVVWSIYCLCTGKQNRAWLLAGIAVAFKLQAVFFLPALLVIAIWQRHRIRAVLYALGGFFIWYIPALLAGRSFLSLLSIYPSQMGEYSHGWLGAPNLYALLGSNDSKIFTTVGTLVAVLVVLALMIGLIFYGRRHHVEKFAFAPVYATLPFVLLLPYLLPHMHERYFFLPAVMLAVVAFANRRYVVPAILAQVADVLAYTDTLGNPANTPSSFYAPQLMGLGFYGFIPETAALIITLVLLVRQVRAGMTKRDALPV